MDTNADHTVLNKVEARQGTSRPKLIYVLSTSLALVVIAFVVAELVFRHV